MKVALAAVATLASLGASAQTPSTPNAGPPEPKVERIVVQDEGARIEELRVRGLTQRIVVKPRNAAEYEVVPTPGGRDPSQGRLGSAGAAGQRVWHLFSF